MRARNRAVVDGDVVGGRAANAIDAHFKNHLSRLRCPWRNNEPRHNLRMGSRIAGAAASVDFKFGLPASISGSVIGQFTTSHEPRPQVCGFWSENDALLPLPCPFWLRNPSSLRW